jgi:hypothetical protein
MRGDGKRVLIAGGRSVGLLSAALLAKRAAAKTHEGAA